MPMKKLQLYVLRDTVRALVPAFMTLVVIMAVAFCLQLLNDGLDVVRLRMLLPPLVSYCVPMVLPSAFLTAVIMTFGRLSADNEMLAIRAAGISPLRVIYPVLAVAALLSAVVAYCQFETVPRARGRLKALKYRALQQILMDQVALSARRQFSFDWKSGPVFIKYGDYRDGRMIDVLAMTVENQRPRTIIKAAYGTIQPHPGDPEGSVLFELEDCAITTFDMGQLTGRAAKARIAVTVARDLEEVLSQERYLGMRAMLARLRELRRKVAGQVRIDNPERAYQQLRSVYQKWKRELVDLDAVLEAARNDYQKYAVQRPLAQDQVIATSQARKAELQETLAGLRGQLQAAQMEMREGLTASDYDRLEQLQRTVATLTSSIQAAEKEMAELDARVADAEALKRSYAERAQRFKEQVEVLEAQRQELQRRVYVARRSLRAANDQEDLREIILRIHKRLAQALSVFVFALLGVPVGILAGRRSVMVAFGISFAIVLAVFYPLLIIGQVAAQAGAVAPGPAMWSGNLLTGTIGAVLLTRVASR